MGVVYWSKITSVTSTASFYRGEQALPAVHPLGYENCDVAQSRQIRPTEMRSFYGASSETGRSFIGDEGPSRQRGLGPRPWQWATSADYEDEKVGFRLEKLAHEAKFFSSTRQIKALSSFNILKRSDNRHVILRQIRKKLETGRNEIAWFILLATMTEVNPLSEAERGSIPHMSAAWTRWLRNAEEKAPTANR